MKKAFSLMVASIMSIWLLAGCSSSASSSKSEVASKSESAPTSSSATSSKAESTPEPQLSAVQEQLKGLAKNEYEGLQVAAELDTAKELLPGGVIAINVTVKNTGDKTLVFDHGAEPFVTPTALLVDVDGLQPVLPKDHLGVTDTTHTVRELKAGEEKKFELHILAVEPDKKFEDKVHHLFETDNKYVIDVEWEALHKLFPELKEAAAGEYKGAVYFTYSILAEGETAKAEHTATGYSMAEFSIIVK